MQRQLASVLALPSFTFKTLNFRKKETNPLVQTYDTKNDTKRVLNKVVVFEECTEGNTEYAVRQCKLLL